MSEEKTDRRVQRTRESLRTALMQLVREKGYDAITIQDITDKANIGRSTFYLHYETKDDLLLDHHADFSATLKLQALSPDELQGHAPQPEMIQFLQEMADGKFIYFAIRRAKDADSIMAGIRQQMIERLEVSIQNSFSEQRANVPLDALLNYIIGAQLSLIDWWLSHRTGHSAESIATMLHQLQRVAICSAFDVT